MLIIVAHHYVVNSGLLTYVEDKAVLDFRDYFLLLFGWGGKMGIDCFVMITGYFMCTSVITLRKWLKLFLEIEFYKIVIYILFAATGYESISIVGFAKVVFPFFDISTGFTSCFLLFYLFIPYLNILIKNLTDKEHLSLLLLCIFVYTVLPSFIKANVTFNYIIWFSVIYVIASYIRLHPKKIYEDTRLWGVTSVVSLLLSFVSIICIAFLTRKVGKDISLSYFFVNDSNKILAVATAICLFMFFKNLNIEYSRFINTVAASTFGVLLIHANSDTMRQWLWHDVCNNVGFYTSKYLVIHALVCVVIIYVACTLIDYLRIRFIERPVFKYLDKIYDK